MLNNIFYRKKVICNILIFMLLSMRNGICMHQPQQMQNQTSLAQTTSGPQIIAPQTSQQQMMQQQQPMQQQIAQYLQTMQQNNMQQQISPQMMQPQNTQQHMVQYIPQQQMMMQQMVPMNSNTINASAMNNTMNSNASLAASTTIHPNEPYVFPNNSLVSNNSFAQLTTSNNRIATPISENNPTPSRRNSLRINRSPSFSSSPSVPDSDGTDEETDEIKKYIKENYKVAILTPTIDQDKILELRRDLKTEYRNTLFQFFQYYNFNISLMRNLEMQNNSMPHENLNIYEKKALSLKRLFARIQSANPKNIPQILSNYMQKNNQILDTNSTIPENLLTLDQGYKNMDEHYNAITRILSCALFHMRNSIFNKHAPIAANNEPSTIKLINEFYENLPIIIKNDELGAKIAAIAHTLSPMNITSITSISSSTNLNPQAVHYKFGHPIGISKQIARLFNIKHWNKALKQENISENKLTEAATNLSMPETPCQLLLLSLLQKAEIAKLEADATKLGSTLAQFDYKVLGWKILEILAIGAACALWIFSVLSFWYLAALNSESTCMAAVQVNGTSIIGVRVK